MKKTIYHSGIALSFFALTACTTPINNRTVLEPPVIEAVENNAPITEANLELSDESSKEVEQPTIAVNEEFVDSRLEVYGKRLERWKIIDANSLEQNLSLEQSDEIVNCFKGLQKVLNGYSLLKTSLLSSNPNATMDNGTILNIQENDITFSESSCGQMLTPVKQSKMTASNGTAPTGLGKIESQIKSFSRQLDFENVLQTWESIPKDQRDMLNLETKVLHAQALANLQQDENSARAYEKIIKSLTLEGKNTDIISLRKDIADLYTASNNYEKATEQYKLINDDYLKTTKIKDWSNLQLSILKRSGTDAKELEAYSKLLKDYLSFVPATDGYKIVQDSDAFLKKYPYTPVASNVDIIKQESTIVADKWYGNLENKVQEFKDNNEYEAAINYLQAIPLSLFDPEKAASITKQIEELLLADAIDRETNRMSKMQDMQKTWNNGQLLVNAERNDEAIEVFKSLIGTDYNDKALDKIDEITLLSAKTDRRKAANAFIRYTKTDVLESQEKLLTESRKILNDIVKKYPNVEIIDKVKRNIERVELEMNKVNPSLLPTLQADELAAPDDIQPIENFDLLPKQNNILPSS